MKVPAVARRAAWNLADQMISSLTNAVLSIIVANSVDAKSFGGFALAFTVFSLVIGATRTIATSPLNIRFADVSIGRHRTASRAATGTSLTIGLVVGLGCVATGLLLEGSVGEALIALGVVLPAVIVQDAYRYVFFSVGRPAAAALNDTAWAVAQLGAVIGLLHFGWSSVPLLLIAWGTSAAAAAVLGARQSGAWPSPRQALRWLRDHRDHTSYNFASFAAAYGANQGAILVIAGIASVVAVGSLRGGQILLGPATLLSTAAFSFAIPELARRKSSFDTRRWIAASIAVSAGVAILAFSYGAFFLLMPDAVGVFLLDASWPGTKELLLAAVLGAVGSAASVGPVAVLYAIDRTSQTLTIQILLGGLTFIGGVGGVMLGGAVAAQWGLSLASWTIVPFWFVRMVRELRRLDHAPYNAKESDADTVKIAAVPAAARFMDDITLAQMSTMIIPRVEWRPPNSKPRNGTAGAGSVAAQTTRGQEQDRPAAPTRSASPQLGPPRSVPQVDPAWRPSPRPRQRSTEEDATRAIQPVTPRPAESAQDARPHPSTTSPANNLNTGSRSAEQTHRIGRPHEAELLQSNRDGRSTQQNGPGHNA